MTVSLLSTICPVPPFPSYTEHSSGKDMTTETFSDYVAQQDARNTIQLNVRKWTLMLCDALVDNFKSRNHGKVGGYDAPVYKFYPEEGRKYFKVIMTQKYILVVNCFDESFSSNVHCPC